MFDAVKEIDFDRQYLIEAIYFISYNSNGIFNYTDLIKLPLSQFDMILKQAIVYDDMKKKEADGGE